MRVQPGRMFVFETQTLTNPKFIINFPTKRHWCGKSRIEDLQSGLKALVEEIRERGIHSGAVRTCEGPFDNRHHGSWE